MSEEVQYEISERRILEGRPFTTKGLLERDLTEIPAPVSCEALDEDGKRRRPKQSDIYPSGPWECRYDPRDGISYWTHIEYTRRLGMWQYRRKVEHDAPAHDWQAARHGSNS